MLTEDQKNKLRTRAADSGVDPDALIAEAEKITSASDQTGNAAPSPGSAPTDPPKLFQYHLPFVTVREVRQVWLGLTEAFPGDNRVAAEWAAEHGGGSSPVATPATPDTTAA